MKGGVVTKLAGAKYPEQVFTADPARWAWSLPMAVLALASAVLPGAASV